MSFRSSRFRLASFLFLFLILPSSLFAEEFCVYRNEAGVERKVRSVKQIPRELRPYAKCFKKVTRPTTNNYSANKLAKANEMKVDGLLARRRLNTSVGPVNLRWARSSKEILGRTPERAVADAGRMVSKALKQEGFPGTLSSLDIKWEIVFMDENLPVAQVPAYLQRACHPAWMTPPKREGDPANVYVVVQRVAAGCGGSPPPSPSEADAKMAEVLAHEMGHAVEAAILKGAFGGERWRAEGFATFFERIASEYSQVIPAGSVRRQHQKLARQSFRSSPKNFNFQGTAYDYARASMYIEAVVADRGIKGLLRVYDRIKKGEGGVIASMQAETGWSRKQIEEKAREAAGL